MTESSQALALVADPSKLSGLARQILETLAVGWLDLVG